MVIVVLLQDIMFA